MHQFRYNTVLLLIFLSLFFNIDRIYNDLIAQIQIEPFIYFHSIILVISICYFPMFQKIHIGKLLALNLALFVIEKILISSAYPLLGGMYTYLTITEMTGLSLLLYLAHRQSQSISHFEQAVGQVSFGNDLLHPISTIEDSMHDIQTHMHFSRRHTTPLSVIVVEPKPESLHYLIQYAFHEAHRKLQAHCSLTKLATLFRPALRRTDLVLENRQHGRLLIVCPGTAPEEILTLTNRLQITADQHDMSIRFGYASFPSEAFTFDELILQAELHLHAESPVAQPQPSPSHVESAVLADVQSFAE